MSLITKVTRELKDIDGNLITDMNADWTSRPYSMDQFLHLSIQLRWSDIALTGVVYIEYSNDTCNDGSVAIEEEDWCEYNAINLDGSFKSLMLLDRDLAAFSFRLRFVHVSGTASISKVFINRKRTW